MFKWIRRSQIDKQSVVYSDDDIRLANVLNKVEALILSKDIHSIRTIIYIIRIYTDRYVMTRSAELLEKDYLSYEALNPVLFSVEEKYVTNKNYLIELGKVPVIANPFNSDKLLTALQRYGNDINPWKYDKNHHLFGLFAPLGITVITDGGNHSVTDGLIKSQGVLYATKENTYDITHCYNDYLYRDRWFLKINHIQNKESLFCEASFESAVLFEIGRLLIKHRINLIEYFPYTL